MTEKKKTKMIMNKKSKHPADVITYMKSVVAFNNTADRKITYKAARAHIINKLKYNAPESTLSSLYYYYHRQRVAPEDSYRAIVRKHGEQINSVVYSYLKDNMPKRNTPYVEEITQIIQEQLGVTVPYTGLSAKCSHIRKKILEGKPCNYKYIKIDYSGVKLGRPEHEPIRTVMFKMFGYTYYWRESQTA